MVMAARLYLQPAVQTMASSVPKNLCPEKPIPTHLALQLRHSGLQHCNLLRPMRGWGREGEEGMNKQAPSQRLHELQDEDSWKLATVYKMFIDGPDEELRDMMTRNPSSSLSPFFPPCFPLTSACVVFIFSICLSVAFTFTFACFTASLAADSLSLSDSN